jgi:hypothetical protein
MTIEQEIIEAVHKLTEEQKRELLEHARRLTRPKGTPGKLAVQYARELNFAPEDLAEMEKAIEEWCERIDDSPAVKFDE